MNSQAFREWIENLGNIKWTPLKAIKAKCIECCGGEGIPSKCEIKTCPLYWYLLEYKRKKEATPKKTMSDEQKAKMREGLVRKREMKAK